MRLAKAVNHFEWRFTPWSLCASQAAGHPSKPYMASDFPNVYICAMRLSIVLGVLTLSVCIVGHPHRTAPAREPGNYQPCSGADMLEVTNPGNMAVDVYA